MVGCQSYGPFLGSLNIRCCIIIGIQKGTIILITTHMMVKKISVARLPVLGEYNPLIVVSIFFSIIPI